MYCQRKMSGNADDAESIPNNGTDMTIHKNDVDTTSHVYVGMTTTIIVKSTISASFSLLRVVQHNVGKSKS